MSINISDQSPINMDDKTRTGKKSQKLRSQDDPKFTDTKIISKLLEDLKIVNIFEDDDSSSRSESFDDRNKSNPGNKDSLSNHNPPEKSLTTNTCMVCSEIFEDLLEQRQHFKLDWHRYNLKRKLQGLSRIPEDEFNILVENNSLDGLDVLKRKCSEVSDDDEVESLSGSESESDSEDSEISDRKENEIDDKTLNSKHDDDVIKQFRHPKIFVESNRRKYSIYKCILSPKEDDMRNVSSAEWLNSIQELPERLNWAIFMLGGGHFAAAVFNGEQVVAHKTFHCYTVRRKQGGGQSAADNKSGGKHKSAGASLRRYNEASLAQHVQDIVQSWQQEYLSKCHLIFYRAASSNRKILFGSATGSTKNNPILGNKDPRVRSIPFPTRRATFKELKRVHQCLITIQPCKEIQPLPSTSAKLKDSANLGNENHISDRRPRQGKSMNSHKISQKQIRRSKSRESPKRQLPDFVQKLADSTLSDAEKSNSSDVELHFEVHEVMTETLKEYDHTPVKGKKKGKKKGKTKNLADDTAGGQDEFERSNHDWLDEVMNQLTTACKVGNKNLLIETISATRNMIEKDDSDEQPAHNDIKCVEDILNNGFGGVTTALHIASQYGYNSIIEVLLDHGADPTIKDKSIKTPYNLAPNRETRNVFRRFQARWPERYNWTDACIPTNDLLTPEEEARQEEKRKEKRKAQRKVKKEKEAIVKQNIAAVQKEEREREAFLKLSDREKRALAAERRILAANANVDNAGPTKEKAELISLSIQRCYQCGCDITGKTPFEYQNFRFCTPKCVKEHRKKCAT